MLGHREFRLYLFGLVASLAGTYMQQVAEGWLVYRLTNSALALGLVGFAVMLPLAPLSIAAGILADRFSRRKLLILTQVGQIVPPIVLAALTWTHLVQVWHIIIVDLVLSAMTAIDQPVRQALLADTIPSASMPSAVSVSATGFNVARVIGPAVGGLLVAFWGEAICFALNGLSFILVAAALVAMNVPDRAPVENRSLRVNVTDAARYLTREHIILASIGFIIVINLFIVPYQTLLPVFARDILNAGPMGLGLMVAAAGVGAIVGSLLAGGVLSHRRGPALILLGFAASLTSTGFAFTRDLGLAGMLLVLVSGCVVASKVIAYTFVQTRVPDDLRGRILSVVTLMDAGAPRLGGLAAGWSASAWGAPVAVQLGAVGCLVGTLCLYRWIPSLRRVP